MITEYKLGRARGVIKVMEKLNVGPKGAVEIRANVLGQILMVPSTHARRSNDDDELPSRAQYLNAFVNGDLYVCSADRGVRLRASLRDLKIIKLPDALRLPAPAPAPSEPLPEAADGSLPGGSPTTPLWALTCTIGRPSSMSPT